MKRKPSKTKRKPGMGRPSKDYPVLHLVNIEITYDDDFHPYDFEITEEIADVVNTYVVLCNKNPKKAAKELPAVIERMPQVPLLRNHLFVALRRLGRHDEAFAVNDQALEDHPDYVYAVMNKAVQHWERDELDEAEKALGGMPLVITRTFPKREVFHISEVFTYYGFLIRFWVSKGNLEVAESHYNLLEELEPGHPQLPELKRLITVSTLQSAFGKLMADIEKSKLRKQSSKKAVPLPKPKKKG